MNVQQEISADRDTVWRALNDAEVLKAAIPGCENLELEDDNRFAAKITAKVGPVKAKFNFRIELSDLDPPNSYTIHGEGQGGPAGFAKGSARVSLAERGSGTLLSYSVKANVGGKLAQLGGRLIDGTARKLADEFFDAFIAIVTDSGSAGAVLTVPAADEPRGTAGTWGWIILGAVVLAAAVVFIV